MRIGRLAKCGMALVLACDASPGAEPTAASPSDAFAFTSYRDGNGEVYLGRGTDTAVVNLTRNPAFDGFPSWSPDGSRIAFDSDRAGGNHDIWVMHRDGSAPENLTRHPGYDFSPSWSPDGEWIAFASARDSDWDPERGNDETFRGEIYRIRPDGTGLERLTRDDAHDQAPAWTPDGRIVYCREEAGDADLWVMASDGSGARRLLGGTDYECSPTVSPDGARIAYRVSRGDSAYLEIRGFDGGAVTRLSLGLSAGWEPAWSPDGTRICFTGDDGAAGLDVYEVPVAGGAPRRLTASPGRDQACAWRPLEVTR